MMKKLVEKYDFIFIDLMSVSPELYRGLFLALRNIHAQKIIFIDALILNRVSFHSSLMDKCITVSEHTGIDSLRCSLKAFYQNREGQGPNGFESERPTGVMNTVELDVIRSISSGEKVKDIASRLRKSDKTIYHVLARVKERLGFKSKHEFLLFLASCNSCEREL